MCWLCHTSLCNCETSMFGASVPPPVQEGAKDPLTSTFTTITRQNCFLPCCCCRVASVVSDCATTETAAHQAPPSLGLSRQEHWSGLPFPSPIPESKKSLSRVRLLATPWTVAYQASPSMRFSKQEYWSGLPFPSPP